MKYTIISERVGTVGAEFVPGAGTNIDALLAHGFIKSDEPTEQPASDKQAPKSAKTKTHTKKD